MNSETLRHMWSRQKVFNSNFVDFENLDFESKQTMTKEYVLHMLSESNSLLEEINWKMHHKKDRSVNRSDLVLELIDVWKYLLSIALVWDITPEEFSAAFEEKSSLVEQRYLQEFDDIRGRRIAICDIDGVLGDYPATFLDFVSREEAIAGYPSQFSSDNVTCLDLYKYLEGKVSTDRLKYYKHIYRSSGEIRKESVLSGAKDFLHTLREKGFYVVLLTSRPFSTYKSLYLDTYMWLTSHGLEFDMLLNDSKKRDKITKLLETSDVQFIVDDDPKIISGLVGIDKLSKIYLMDRPYNQSSVTDEKIVRVSTFDEILEKEEI